MDRMGGCRSFAWVETAPPPLITVRRRALRELALDTILEEGMVMAKGHLLSAAAADHPAMATSTASGAADSSLALPSVGHANVLHQHRPHAVAFAQ